MTVHDCTLLNEYWKAGFVTALYINMWLVLAELLYQNHLNSGTEKSSMLAKPIKNHCPLYLFLWHWEKCCKVMLT